MELYRAEQLATRDVRLDSPETISSRAIETERPGIEIYSAVFERIVNAVEGGDEESRLYSPRLHHVSFSVIFRESPHAVQVRLGADSRTPAPISDALSAIWSYQDSEEQRQELVIEEVNKAQAKDENNKASRNTLLQIEASIKDVEHRLKEGSGVICAVVIP